MKGIELPINILIIIAVAVIVLIAIVAMFYPTFSSGGTTMTSEVAKSSLCQIYVEARRCTGTVNMTTISNFDADRDGVVGVTEANSNWDFAVAGSSECGGSAAAPNEGDNLASLCKCYYSITSETSCRALCGC